ncbi:uncharacterized protein LOC130787512 [Actinidia eriantha]|uniref:uncharacterized protein LOC130787512 n=1 Tax=Actinidia eriantha TaxID=165200 RepID=UPI00258616D5|nr:uncharacterized protein LOC130787512 [Actinidia eriantha]
MNTIVELESLYLLLKSLNPQKKHRRRIRKMSFMMWRDQTQCKISVPSNDAVNAPESVAAVVPSESLFPWKEELECLVRGGVPMAPRGELWQAFVGARALRVEKYYQDLLGTEAISSENVGQQSSQSENTSKGLNADSVYVPEKWKGQIEKVTTYMSFVGLFDRTHCPIHP